MHGDMKFESMNGDLRANVGSDMDICDMFEIVIEGISVHGSVWKSICAWIVDIESEIVDICMKFESKNESLSVRLGARLRMREQMWA